MLMAISSTTFAGIYSIFGPDADYFKADSNAPPATACWSSGRDELLKSIQLMLYVRKPTLPGIIYEVSIEFQNPLPAQEPIEARLEGFDVRGTTQKCEKLTCVTQDTQGTEETVVSLSSWASCDKCPSFITSAVLETPGVGRTNEEALLFIRTGYVTKQIGQSSALSGIMNVIVVTLEFNKELPGSPAGTDGPYTLITISNMSGATPVGDHSNIRFFQTDSQLQWLGGKGEWKGATNEMVLFDLMWDIIYSLYSRHTLLYSPLL